MIYAPILGQPILELDKYVDLTGFDEFSKKVMFAIAKARNMFGIGISGPSTPGVITWLPEEGFLEAGDARVKAVEYFTNEGGWQQDEWNKLRPDEQLFVSMLMFSAKSLCSALALRKLKNGIGNSGRFHLKHLEAETEDTPVRPQFEFVMDWIKGLNIFDEIGRVQFFINTDGHGTPIHRDYAEKSHADQFIWVKFFDNKKFFVFDREENVKHYVKGRVATFDNHQWHGGDPGPGYGISLRVDGKFNSRFLNETGLTGYVKS